ncbi:MAG: hypothetical protein M0R40_08175 [Firmicutes bacterium]|nr:hypothetical protein [Bacillota bacterium]
MTGTRPRFNPPHLQRRQLSNSDDNTFATKVVRQFFVSAVVFILVFAISKTNFPMCKTIADSVKNTLSYTIDYKKATEGIVEEAKKLTQLLKRAPFLESETTGEESGENSNESIDEGESADAAID